MTSFYQGVGKRTQALCQARDGDGRNARTCYLRYLRFIKGVVDSSDLPLEYFPAKASAGPQITQIRKWLTRKVLDALGEMQVKEPEKYRQFWTQFGRALKEGFGSDYDNKERLLPLLLFESSHDPKDSPR